MKTIRQWISFNPWTAVLLSWLFGATAAVAGCRPDWFWYMVGIFLLGVFIMVFSMMWRWTTPLGLVLAILVVDVPTTNAQEPTDPQFEPAGAAGLAVVVVCVGGVVVYLLVKTCQRVFPKTPAPSTNSPPDIRGGGGVDSAGSWSYYASVSCYVPQSDAPQWPQVTMELNGFIEDEATFRLTGSRRLTRAEDSQDYFAFQNDLARHGITMGPVGTMNFGRNCRPAEQQETPIRFATSGSDHLAAVYSDTAPSVPLVLQRSFDLKTWKDFGFVSVPIGQPFRLIDTTTAESVFYRIQPR